MNRKGYGYRITGIGYTSYHIQIMADHMCIVKYGTHIACVQGFSNLLESILTHNFSLKKTFPRNRKGLDLGLSN